ncbi:MAG: GNAT family N-acetyltransferase [Proteobacteria bacterium]|nr:GNAT family N-acetyltransferase [Pseudomonadota bacterium]
MRARLAPATHDDVAGLHAMIVEFAQFERLAHLCTGTPDDLAAALFAAPPAVEAVLLHVDGEAAGFALYFGTYSTFLGRRGLWLEDLYVRPAWRGQGHGRALLAHVASVAVARGCGRFEWSVLDWNTPAIAFYEAQGATVLPDWRIARVTGEALAALAQPADLG